MAIVFIIIAIIFAIASRRFFNKRIAKRNLMIARQREENKKSWKGLGAA